MFKKVQIRSFKCFKDTDITLSNFHILIGPNASGKTTFLEIFSLVKDVVSHGIGPRGAIERRSSEIRELVFLGKGDRFEIALESPIPEKIAKTIRGNYDSIRYELRLGYLEGLGTGSLTENLWLIPTSQSSLFKESTPVVRERKPPNCKEIIRRKDPRKFDIFRAERAGNGRKEDWFTSFMLGIENSALASLPDDREIFPASVFFKEILRNAVTPVFLNVKAMRSPSRLDAPDSFETDGSNMAKVIYNLSKTNSEVFQRWLQHVRSFLPDIQSISAKKEEKGYYIIVTYSGGAQVPSWLLSDGTLRFLALTLLAYLDKPAVYLIDEPENGLHPLAIDGVYQSLSSLYESQVFIATHSPVLLGLAKKEEILLFKKEADGSVKIMPGQDHPVLKKWKEKPDMGTLFASGIL